MTRAAILDYFACQRGSDTRHAHTRHATRDTRHTTHDTRHATRDTRHATRDTRHATHDTRHATRDTRHASLRLRPQPRPRGAGRWTRSTCCFAGRKACWPPRNTRSASRSPCRSAVRARAEEMRQERAQLAANVRKSLRALRAATHPRACAHSVRSARRWAGRVKAPTAAPRSSLATVTRWPRGGAVCGACVCVEPATRVLLQSYPELGFYRDIVFLFKFMMCPLSQAAPPLTAPPHRFISPPRALLLRLVPASFPTPCLLLFHLTSSLPRRSRPRDTGRAPRRSSRGRTRRASAPTPSRASANTSWCAGITREKIFYKQVSGWLKISCTKPHACHRPLPTRRYFAATLSLTKKIFCTFRRTCCLSLTGCWPRWPSRPSRAT
jgi:hypothetical protein